MVGVVADRLAAADEELHAGDRIITGVLAPPHKAAPGDHVRLELDGIGAVELAFASTRSDGTRRRVGFRA